MAVTGEVAAGPHGSGTAGSLLQPALAGLLAAVVGFGSTFTVILAGYTAVGATPAQAASGLMTICILQGVLGIVLSVATRLPVSIAWSTPGAALMIATGAQPGGYPAALGASVLAGLLIALAGIWGPFRRAVQAIPASLANALLAGIVFEICLAPVAAVHQAPGLVLPIVLAWMLAVRFARRFAVPIAVAAAALVVLFAAHLPPGATVAAWPVLVPTLPVVRWETLGTLALPLFVVTMASQNIPGLAVLRANGYQPPLRGLLVSTGLTSVASALGSGGLLNLAAITAALCAGPEAHPDPARRWIASAVAGGAYIVLGLFAASAAAFIVASPPSLIQAVAGLALMGSLAGALAGALAPERDRLAVAVTFVTVASGVSFAGVGAAFWGLLIGGLLLAAERRRR